VLAERRRARDAARSPVRNGGCRCERYNTLVDAGLVTVQRRHRCAYYSISSDALRELTEWLS
jgi:hypothetical protein